jgi:diguanylate cyclase (GGDEF)-like protein/PAS domain S-box-containing protein
LVLLSAILIVPLAWLGIGQYQQIHASIAATNGEQRGLNFIAQAVRVLQQSARVDRTSPDAASAEVEAGMVKLTHIAAGMTDLPVAARRVKQLRASWARAGTNRDPASLAQFGDLMLDAIGDVADASRFTFESQIEVGDMADALDDTYAHQFERLIAAYRSAVEARPGEPAPVEARIAIAGELSRAGATLIPLNTDLQETLRQRPSLQPQIERPWQQSGAAAAELQRSLVDIMNGRPLTPELAARLEDSHARLLETSGVFFGRLIGVTHDLLEERLAGLDRADRILTSVGFAGCAMLVGMSILVGRAVGRRHRNELLVAQRDTERLSAELARQRAERALLLTEAQFRAIFERSQLGIALLASDGTTVECNGALRGILGEGVTSLFLPDDSDLAELLEGRRDTYQVDRHFERADGKGVWVEITVSPVTVPQPEETAAIAIVQDITRRKAVDDKLRFAASHDELTALPNRTEFVREVSAVLADREHCERNAVLFIDLDGFKMVNDGLGHFAGDRVLAASARRLRSACRPGDVVARFHGDEFAILLRDVNGEQAARAAADRVQSELRTPISVGGSVAMVTSSVGIVMLHAGYADAEQVLRNADAAMYHAKARGRSHTAVFDDSMYQKVASHFRIASELRDALKKGQIHLAYQPIVALGDASVVGLEGLLRWDHPEFGSIPPADFIPVAEESEVIFELGRFALEKAGAMLAMLDRDHPALSPPSISVNLSVAQLAQRDILEDVRRSLRENRLEGNRLLLEVTETAIMDNGAHASAMFAQLRDLGVRLCIDDFGTGYSSLRYLHEFPFDVLKIDRSFICGADGHLANAPIITMLMNLADSLKVTVIAEGIETEEQRVKLREGGCRLGQGFLFAPALAEQAVAPWLEAMAERRSRRPRLRIAP